MSIPFNIPVYDRLLYLAPSVIDGIDRVMLAFKEDDEWNLKAIVRDKSGYKEINIDYTSKEYGLKHILRNANGYTWLNKNNMPFDSRSTDISSLNLFSEYENLVLQINCISPFSHREYVYFLYFRDDSSNFGIYRDKGPLPTQVKTIIGNLISKFYIASFESFVNDKNTFEHFAQKTRQLLKNVSNSGKNDDEKRSSEDFIFNWSQDYLRNLSDSHGFNYVYNYKVETLIRNYKGEYRDLKSAIEKAVEYAQFLSFGKSCEEIMIDETFFEIPNCDSDQNTKFIAENDSFTNVNNARVDKSESFLDRLEQAAITLYNNGETLTSLNVGQSMNKPISAPAISDALKKKRNTIIHLLDRHPDRWKLIRKQFKPLLNILDNRFDDKYQSA